MDSKRKSGKFLGLFPTRRSSRSPSPPSSSIDESLAVDLHMGVDINRLKLRMQYYFVQQLVKIFASSDNSTTPQLNEVSDELKQIIDEANKLADEINDALGVTNAANQIDAAIKFVGSIKSIKDNISVGIVELDTRHVFDQNGELKPEFDAEFQIGGNEEKGRVSVRALRDGHGIVNAHELSLRERIIFDGICFDLAAQATEKFKQELSIQPIQDQIDEINKKGLSPKANRSAVDPLMERLQKITTLPRGFYFGIFENIPDLHLSDHKSYALSQKSADSLCRLRDDLALQNLIFDVYEIQQAYLKLEKNGPNKLGIATLLQNSLEGAKDLKSVLDILYEAFSEKTSKRKSFLGKDINQVDFIEKLNKNQDDHHYTRLIGLLLKKYYEETGRTNIAEYAMVKDINVPNDPAYALFRNNQQQSALALTKGSSS